MSDTPKVIGIILCERVLQDVLRADAVSCVNIYNGIRSQAFPAVIPLLYAFAQLSGATQEFTYSFKLIDSAGREVAASPEAKVEPLPSKFMTHKLISVFSGIAFQAAGLYDVILEVEGKRVSTLPFQVEQFQPEAVA